MKILLKSLKLSNFKGIREYRLMFDNTRTQVYGANATGKTSLADAFFFIFTGKDSQERLAKDWIQTLDGENNKVHKLEHEAEIMLELDGDLITLGRKVQEKWTKPRGQHEEVLAETLDYTYYIDGVPTPAKTFETFLKEKFMADIINILSNPMSFCGLDWKKQREMLYKVCGSATDEEVIATDARFEFLREALRHKDIETLKAALRKSIKAIQDEVKALDAVIKDRRSSLIKEYDVDEVLKEKAEKESYIKELNKQLEAGSEVFEKIKEKQKMILEIEKMKDKAIKEHENVAYKKRDDAKEKLSKAKISLNNVITKKEYAVATIETCRQEMVILDKQIQDQRDKWMNKNKESLPEGETVCPCCGQDMPEHKLIEINQNFNDNKVLELEKIINKANRLKSNKSTEESKIAVNEKILSECEAEEDRLNNIIEPLEPVANAVVDVEPFDTTSLDVQIEDIQQEISEFVAVDNTELKEKIVAAQKDLQIIAIKENKCKQYDEAVEQIKMKEAEKLQKQKDVAEVEIQLINATDFVTTKVQMLEDKVNAKFQTVKFKLFKLNQKGNYEETCTALVDGVDWSIANTAAKIQSGMEICNALQEHFGLYAPIWVDNKESVTELPNTKSQLITLNVSESDKELRVE